MLETIIVVLVVLWLLGSFGHVALPALAFESHGLIHGLLVIVVFLIVLRLLNIL